uniref:Reverse transcriptase zinc-binding domain-containing protein n=1 Tax=Lactuca sativa TaxID=4236 RepID=A0A9R1WI10_LACSA|nr:hypothetical protein LSAT_V11C200066810 [Lactuca sativa]
MRAKIGRFPSVMALQRRGVWLESTTCKYCNHEEECGDHILVQCPFARLVMKWVFKWCGIHTDPFNTIAEVLNFATGWGNCPKKRRILQVICYGTLWSIWRARNDRLFNNQRISHTLLADRIKFIVFTWIKFKRTFARNMEWID